MSSLGDLYTHLKTLCEQWFYNKSTSDARFSAIGHSHDVGNLTDNNNTAFTPKAHNQASSTITDTATYSNIGNSAQTQASINSAINTKLGELSGIEVIKVVSDKGTASASTMNKLYIEVGANSTDVYYTVKSGTSPNFTYSWNKMDTDILDDLSIDWSNINNIPSSFTPSSHTHGYIQNGGTLKTVNKNTEKVKLDADVKTKLDKETIFDIVDKELLEDNERND